MPRSRQHWVCDGKVDPGEMGSGPTKAGAWAWGTPGVLRAGGRRGGSMQSNPPPVAWALPCSFAQIPLLISLPVAFASHLRPRPRAVLLGQPSSYLVSRGGGLWGQPCCLNYLSWDH